jgi:hypothetical protein
VCGALPAAAAAERGEARVKAGFLYNFAKYTDWPGGDAERVLCLAPQALPESAAQGIDGLPLGGAALRVRAIGRPEDSGPCDILYVGAMPRAPSEHWLRAVENRPVLTISDGQSGMRSGVMIHIFAEGLRIRFDLYPDRARQHGLKFSSRLMNLADTVHNE